MQNYGFGTRLTSHLNKLGYKTIFKFKDVLLNIFKVDIIYDGGGNMFIYILF